MSNDQNKQRYTHWNVDNQKINYTPVKKVDSASNLEPGYYKPYQNMQGEWHLNKQEIKLDGLVTFTEGANRQIINEIDLFWKSEEKFKQINKSIKVIYKRGILMYGPPGCGKSSLISLVMKDVIEKGGIALGFHSSGVMAYFVDIIREIQPGTKIVIVIEDVDGYIARNGEVDLLNMLDGIGTSLENVLFLATSNYAEKLSPRMLRPSRFDLKIKLEYPSESMRKKYLQELFKANDTNKISILNRYVRDTNGFTFADLKELFISTCIFGFNYESCLASLKGSLHDDANKKGGSVLANWDDEKNIKLAPVDNRSRFVTIKKV